MIALLAALIGIAAQGQQPTPQVTPPPNVQPTTGRQTRPMHPEATASPSSRPSSSRCATIPTCAAPISRPNPPCRT